MLGCIGAGLAGLALSAAPSQAANRRVSISNFQWSNPNPKVDLGESVTWDWIGPDTQHSVTGQKPNATQWDSDPGSVRSHSLGDTFTVVFDHPGAYLFQCKLHSSVRGTVTVSNKPGDPSSDAGPQAPLNLDLENPDFNSVYLTQTTLGPKGKGTGLNFAIDERGTVSADYYKLVKKGHGKRRKTVRSFKGYQDWENHIGFNNVKFANRTSDFRAKPGKYVALVTATDQSANTTPSTEIRFKIKKKNKK